MDGAFRTMAHPAIASLGAGPSSVISSSARVASRQRAPIRVSGSAFFDRRAASVGVSERARQRRGRGIEAVAASTGVKVDRFGASVAADFPPRFERPSSPSCSVGLELEEDFLDARDDAPDENEVTTTRQCLDSRKVALGSLALFVLVGGVAAIHPDPALAREVTLELPDFDIPDFEVPDIPTTPMEFLEVVTTNPYAAVAASVAAYLVIPKAAELLVKYVLVPALVLLVAYEASQNPDETIALVASAINQARDHPTVTSGIILAILALVLSPYILVAAGVGLIVSGVQLLPDQLKPVLPAPVREIETQIEQLQRAVDPGVKRARALGSQAKARGEKLRQEADAQKARLEAERDRRLREQAEAAAERIEETRAALVAPVVTAQKAAEEAAKETLERAQDVTEAMAEAGEGAGQTVKCTSYPTPQERSSCVDRQREERRQRESKRTEELREKASRLRAYSAERERPVPDVGKALLGGGESS